MIIISIEIQEIKNHNKETVKILLLFFQHYATS